MHPRDIETLRIEKTLRLDSVSSVRETECMNDGKTFKVAQHVGCGLRGNKNAFFFFGFEMSAYQCQYVNVPQVT